MKFPFGKSGLKLTPCLDGSCATPTIIEQRTQQSINACKSSILASVNQARHHKSQKLLRAQVVHPCVSACHERTVLPLLAQPVQHFIGPLYACMPEALVAIAKARRRNVAAESRLVIEASAVAALQCVRPILLTSQASRSSEHFNRSETRFEQDYSLSVVILARQTRAWRTAGAFHSWRMCSRALETHYLTRTWLIRL